MKEFLKQVNVVDYPEFRKRTMEKCHWTKDQYNFRRSGRTKLSPLERDTIREIVNNLHKREP